MYDQETWHPRFIFNNSFNKHFLKLVFFQKYSAFCRVKTFKVEVDFYLKLEGGEGGF